VIGQVRRYLRLLGGAHGLLVASLVASLAQSALLVPIPLVIKHVFDTDLHRGDSRGVAEGGAVVLVLYLANSALALWTRYTVLKATKRAMAQLRRSLLAKIYALPQSFHDRHDAGELHATIVQDSERLDIVANAAVGQMLPAAVVALGLAVVALVLDPLLFALLACAIPGMVLVKRRLGTRLRAHTRAWQHAFDRFSVQTQLALRMRTLTEVRAAEQGELEHRSTEIDRLSAAGLEMAWRQSALSISQGAIAAVAGVLVLVVGGRAVAQGRMSTGELLSFYAIVALLQGQVSTVTAFLPLAISGRESLDRLDAFLDVDEPPPYRGTREIAFRGGIELRDVSFGYGDDPLLRHVDLLVAPEEHVVILGPNGAGKSTLANLIFGLYRPWAGVLLADGIPYDTVDMRLLRSSFGVILQDPVIFPGTVAENIAYGRPAATAEDIVRAAEMAGVAEFVDDLPGGYGARVGQEGALLSGGQRQRIAIARALLGGPQLLILDEPTTHLDDAAISRLRAVLADLPRRPTVITITHDEALAGQADRVLSLRDGQLADPILSPTTRFLA
jgi:ABC-type multidrug transport system fused ATPase/permease subunit